MYGNNKQVVQILEILKISIRNILKNHDDLLEMVGFPCKCETSEISTPSGCNLCVLLHELHPWISNCMYCKKFMLTLIPELKTICLYLQRIFPEKEIETNYDFVDGNKIYYF